MPGAMGVVGAPDPERFAAALRKLAVLPRAGAQQYAIEPGIWLAAAQRGHRDRPGVASFARDDAAAVLIYGTAFRGDPHPHVVSADDLLEPLRAGRLVDAMSGCDGGYSVVGVDLRQRTATVFADRHGSQPIYFGTGEHGFAFGPEAKAVLTLTGIEPRYSRAGIMGFLALGYNIATETLFEGVRYLEPGTVLTLDLATGDHSVRRYWALEFGRGGYIERRGEAEEALVDGILRAHRLLLVDAPTDHQVLLSGGYDSRGMLAALRRIGRPPAQAIAWGLSKDVRWSDAYIAERIATALRVPFRFLPYTSEALLENAQQWAFVSELANDNLGWYGEGVGSLRDFYAAAAGVSFIGDETWGSGPRLAGDAQARAATIPPAYPPLAREVLTRAAATEACERYEAAVARVLSPFSAPISPGDCRDYVHVHGRAARFLMSLGYYKEHATELRRPFLSRPVLDVVTRLPDRLRIFKNVYCTTLTRFFPEVMRFPVNVVSSLPSWPHDIRRDPRLRELYRGLLDWAELERGPVAALLERRSFEAARDRFFDGPDRPTPPRGVELRAVMHTALNRSRLLTRANTLRKALRVSTDATDITTPFVVLHRIALLSLLHRQLGDLGRTA